MGVAYTDFVQIDRQTNKQTNYQPYTNSNWLTDSQPYCDIICCYTSRTNNSYVWYCACLLVHFSSVWNCAGLWVHCNDSVVTACSVDDVHKTQAYIVVYIRVQPKITRKRQPINCKTAKHARVELSVPYDLRSRATNGDEVTQPYWLIYIAYHERPSSQVGESNLSQRYNHLTYLTDSVTDYVTLSFDSQWVIAKIIYFKYYLLFVRVFHLLLFEIL